MEMIVPLLTEKMNKMRYTPIAMKILKRVYSLRKMTTIQKQINYRAILSIGLVKESSISNKCIHPVKLDMWVAAKLSKNGMGNEQFGRKNPTLLSKCEARFPVS